MSRERAPEYIIRMTYYGQDCLVVRVPGQESKRFKTRLYGSEQAAMRAAETYRDQLVNGTAPKVKERPPRAGNEAGVSGVRRKTIRGKEHWIAEWNAAPNKPVRRTFSVDKWGEEKAMQLAIEAREKKK